MRKYSAFALFVLTSLFILPVRHDAGESPADNPQSHKFRAITVGDKGVDADHFLWGTEVYPAHIATVAKEVLRDTLPVRYLKIRLQENFFSSKDGKGFSPNVCMPSPSHCVHTYNMDDVVATLRVNGWSMMPMISHNPGKPVTREDIDTYVAFVDWFVSRYKTDASIRYVELTNAPFAWESMTTEQLAELQNKVYDRIKGKYPEIMIGTPGFEYGGDPEQRWVYKGLREIEYFLDKRNNVRFDFWAFHGYPGMDSSIGMGALPPTRRALKNKYAGPAGILEIRKKLDANGWTDRMIIDTEHVNVIGGIKPFITDEEDALTAAYTVQELLIKRTLTINGRNALNGLVPLKIAPRGGKGEFLFASMKPDGSLTRTVRAVGLLVSKLKGYKHSSHISGDFDKEDQVWIKKFITGNKELYIFFKPFKSLNDRELTLDGLTVNYILTFSKRPASLVLTGITGIVKYPVPGMSIELEAVNAPQFLEVSYE